MAGLIIAGITILEIGVFIKSLVNIKEEDPLREIKRELLTIEILMYGIINYLCLPNLLIHIGMQPFDLEGGRAMYLEEKVEYLEKQIEELKEQKKNELYLSPAQFAEKMSCSRSMVTKLVQNGEIEALRLGKLIRIPMSQFEEKEGSKEASWKDVVFKGA